MQVAILGAPQTGKTQLAQALKARFSYLNLDLDVWDLEKPELLHQTDLVLLCGLDLTPATEQQQAADNALRTSLAIRQQAFQVVYGQGAQRLENALFCIGRQFSNLATQLARTEIPPRWEGACETCGDGSCEHRLFTRLVQR